jgi:hypothetical protein
MKESKPHAYTPEQKASFASRAAKGGNARRDSLSPEDRATIASNAAKARWSNVERLLKPPATPAEVALRHFDRRRQRMLAAWHEFLKMAPTTGNPREEVKTTISAMSQMADLLGVPPL